MSVFVSALMLFLSFHSCIVIDPAVFHCFACGICVFGERLYREIISSDQSDQNTLSSVNKNNSNTLFV